MKRSHILLSGVVAACLTMTASAAEIAVNSTRQFKLNQFEPARDEAPFTTPTLKIR